MLQVFDDSRHSFVDALSNDLYHDLKSSSTRFVVPKDGDGNLRGGNLPMSMSARTANADRSGGIAKGQSLLLTWNNDDDEHDYPSNDDDVIAMYCPANEAKRTLEIFAMQQQLHKPGHRPENTSNCTTNTAQTRTMSCTRMMKP